MGAYAEEVLNAVLLVKFVPPPLAPPPLTNLLKVAGAELGIDGALPTGVEARAKGEF